MSLRCCEGCGRDTRSATGYCSRCIGRPRVASRSDGDLRSPMEYEDRYDEESGPDDVCDDKYI